MAQSDAELIQQILQGNQDAFGPLVKKYQKGVHALVWRKVGDFHIAQEIAQDAFLKAYEKLGTLKNHKQFPGWLYVIAANMSRDWLRKRALPEQSLEETDASEVDQVSYSQYVEEKREADADETRREVVKELLEKLPESERTVMTLYYLGEMTIKVISEFLGVSQNTVKSRLSRARNRLRTEEDVIQHNLGSFQLPDQWAENIMREVSRMPPISTSVSKPIAPLALSAASAVLIFLLMGVGTQYLSRFQKPYSLDAVSEPKVEIIDAVFVLDSPAKPAVRSQAGNSDTPGKNPGAGQKPDASLFTTVPVDTTEIPTPSPQWVQTGGPEGGSVQNLFIASNRDLYAVANTDLYRSTDDTNAWRRVNSSIPIQGSWQMTEQNNTLYAISDTQVLTSLDRGETWNMLGTRPEGQLIGIVITDEALYLGLVNGVFQSADAGKSWTSLNDDISDRKIHAITAIGNTLFVGTDAGLYRRRSEGWEHLSVGNAENIRALTSAEDQLYVVVGREPKSQTISPSFIAMSIRERDEVSPSLYRSGDLGDSWQPLDFTKIDSSDENGFDFNTAEIEKILDIIMIASENNLLIVDIRNTYYSNDSGETWANTPNIGDVSTLVSLDANTFYKSGTSGIYHTTDAGRTWHPFNTGLVKTTVLNLVSADNVLYANIEGTLVSSSDGGESWVDVSAGIDNVTSIMKFEDVVYARGVKEISPQLFHLSAEDNTLLSVSGMPVLKISDYNELIKEKNKNMFSETVQDDDQKNIGERKKLNTKDVNVDTSSEDYSEIIEESLAELMYSLFGSFAVSNSAYYMPFGQKLLRWKPGMTEWYDTGLTDEGNSTYDFDSVSDFSTLSLKLAALDEIVYVGKHDGRLFQSFDEGNTWSDVTADLPFSVTAFNTIVFAGSTVYVATDKGVVHSDDGMHWHTATDLEGTPVIIDKFAVDGTTVYGTSNQQVYQLKENSDTWQQVTPAIPVLITSLAVDRNVLYVGTIGSGVLRFTLEESN